jgi:hypothetical protein
LAHGKRRIVREAFLALHRVTVSGIARNKRAGRGTRRRKAAPAIPPKPASAASTESFQCTVSEEDIDRGTGARVDFVQRFKLWV